MVFAEIDYAGPYEAKHGEISALLNSRFDHVQAALQSDSWIWVRFGEDKVAVDTFTAMTHQVKSARPGKHVDDVIAVLKEKFTVVVYEEPV
jgi:hypothetical protein